MSNRQILNIIITVVVALLIWKVLAGVIVAVTVPIIVFAVRVLRILLIIAAIAFVLKFLGIKLNK